MKFFATKIENEYCHLSIEDTKHIKTVLRLKNGDKITICDGGFSFSPSDYLCEIQSDKYKILSAKKCENEPSVKVNVFQCLPKAAKMDEIIQKCVELGANSITPVFSENCVPTFESSLKKIERWQKISEAAAKQCGRSIIPKVYPTSKFEEIIDKIDIFAYENARETRINDIIDKERNELNILIGPEGGFSEKEVALATCPLVTLGKRILRTETAAPATLAIIMNILGEI